LRRGVIALCGRLRLRDDEVVRFSGGSLTGAWPRTSRCDRDRLAAELGTAPATLHGLRVPGLGPPGWPGFLGKPFHELGEDYFTNRRDPERETARLIAKLQALGHNVTLEPAA
jgi:hypothetical protein